MTSKERGAIMPGYNEADHPRQRNGEYKGKGGGRVPKAAPKNRGNCDIDRLNTEYEHIDALIKTPGRLTKDRLEGLDPNTASLVKSLHSEYHSTGGRQRAKYKEALEKAEYLSKMTALSDQTFCAVTRFPDISERLAGRNDLTPDRVNLLYDTASPFDDRVETALAANRGHSDENWNIVSARSPYNPDVMRELARNPAYPRPDDLARGWVERNREREKAGKPEVCVSAGAYLAERDDLSPDMKAEVTEINNRWAERQRHLHEEQEWMFARKDIDFVPAVPDQKTFEH
jgi:hypothetical protein